MTRQGIAVSLAALALAAAALVIVNRLGGSDTRVSTSTLIATRYFPAGTSGERILAELNVYQRTPLPKREREEAAIYDREYLRGRVAVVDIFPGQMLKEADFRP